MKKTKKFKVIALSLLLVFSQIATLCSYPVMAQDNAEVSTPIISEEEIMPTASDFNAPIIHSVDLNVKDTVIDSLDTPVTIAINAEDMDGTIASINVNLEVKTGENQWEYLWSEMKEVGQKTFDGTFTYDLRQGCGTKIAISSIAVTDDSNNVAYYDVGHPMNIGGYKYSFAVQEELLTAEVPVITRMTLSGKEYVQGSAESMYIEGDFDKEYKLSGVTVLCENENGIKKDMACGAVVNGVNYFLSIPTDINEEPVGTWRIIAMKGKDKNFKDFEITEENLPGTKEERTFTILKGEETPVDNITIEDPTFEIIAKAGGAKTWEPGVILEEGDTLSIKFEAKHESGKTMLPGTTGTVSFAHSMGYEVQETFVMDIVYNEEKQIFEGSRTILATDYLCEWRLSGIDLWSQPHAARSFEADTPYFFHIAKEGDITLPTYDIGISLYTLIGTGTYGPTQEDIKKTKVARRTKLNTILEGMINPVWDYNGLKHTGWYNEAGKSIEDIEVLNDGYITLYAAYEQTVISVDYSYIGKDMQRVNEQCQKLYDNNVKTYQQALDEIVIEIKQKINDNLPDNFVLEGLEETWGSNTNPQMKMNGIMKSVHLTPKYNYSQVNLMYGYLDKNEQWVQKRIEYMAHDTQTYQDILNANMPKAEELSQIYPISKWQGEKSGQEIDWSQKPQGDREFLVISAQYEGKVVTIVQPQYYAKDDTRNDYYMKKNIVTLVDEGSTYGELFNSILNLEHLVGLNFRSWEGLPALDAVVSQSPQPINARAVYDNFPIKIEINSYCDETGKGFLTKSLFVAVNKGETYGEFLERINLKHYKGLEIEGWKLENGKTIDSKVEDSLYEQASPIYKNCLVQFHAFKDGATIYDEKLVVDKGTSVTLPNIPNQPNIIWKRLVNSVTTSHEPGDTVQVEEHTIFSGESKGPNPKPEDPDEPQSSKVTGVTLNKSKLALTKEGEQLTLEAIIAPTNATNKKVTWSTSDKNIATVENGLVTAVFNGKAIVTATTEDGNYKASCEVTVAIPPKTMPEDQKENVVENIKNGQEGQTITIDMGKDGATVIPKDILEAAREKNVDIVLDMGDYTWTIKSDSISNVNLEDINLEVRKVHDTIPNGLISSLAGNNPVQQISLTHNGNFGFQASLKFKFDPQYQGKFGNLYYYDSSGKMVFQNAGMIDADGYTSLNFSHASDYAIVISETIMGVKVEGLSLNQTSFKFTKQGETTQLTASIQPQDASNKDVVWFSSNDQVATVENGLITAIANGKATITVRTVDGNFAATCEVEVAIDGLPKEEVPKIDVPKDEVPKGEIPKADVPAVGNAITQPTATTSRNIPATGDYSNVTQLLAIMCFAGILLCVCIKKNRSKLD